MKPDARLTKLKFAELLSTSGAGLLGVGLGLLLPNAWAAYGIPILVLGALCHLVGMWRKHRLAAASTAAIPAWHSLLYWGCWLALVVLLASVLWFASQAALPA